MNIKTLEVSGFIGCLKSLKLPFKKECKSTVFQDISCKKEETSSDSDILITSWTDMRIAPSDLKLLQNLIRNGDEHAKSVRLINATAQITAPLYWWSEENTYNVGTTRGCSESTMHTLKKEELTQEDFETTIHPSYLAYLNEDIHSLSIQEAKNALPSGYLQTRVINYNYQTLRRIWLQRKNHKLPEWAVFIEWISTLPMADELIFVE